MKSDEKLIPYIKVYHYHFYDDCISYKKLNFTGKWKIFFDKKGYSVIYVEHRTIFPFIKKWIHENDIEFLLEEREIIYDNYNKYIARNLK